MATMTTTTGASFIPTIWLDEVRAALEAELFLTEKFKVVEHTQSGGTLEIPDISDLSVGDMSETGELNPQAITEGNFQISIDKWKVAPFLLNDLLKVQSSYSLRTEYTKKAGYVIAKQMETDLLATLNANTSGNEFDADGTALTDGGADITLAGILKGVQVLDENNVEQNNRMIIVPPVARNTMLNITNFVSMDFTDNRATVNKKIGELYGMDVLVTNLLTSTTNAQTATKKNVYVCHRDAAVLARQQAIQIEYSRETKNLADLVVASAIYGVKLFRSTNCVQLRLNT